MFDVKKYKSELETLCDFTEIYDQFRLVDPFTSEIYMLKDGKAVLSGEGSCYKIWNRDAPCDNCISRRTCRDHTQYMKLEYLGDSVLLIVAKPIVVDNHQFSLELVTDVTDSMVVQDHFHKNHEQTRIAELIEKVNLLSITDVFTGVYNNAYIKNKITTLTHLVLNEPFSILILDIDWFKQVNDLYGHLAGDAVIQTIAAMLSRFCEQHDYSVGRMGGDEYCMVLEGCALCEAKGYAEQIAREIHTQQYEGQSKAFTVEVSIGVGEYKPGEDAHAFIERVDRALYEEKRKKSVFSPGIEL